jgi:hypothetical protein
LPAPDAFPAVFQELRAILAPYADRFTVTRDGPDAYSLNVAHSPKFRKPLLFGSAVINRSYVSFHLFPVYACPALLAAVSPELRARMQGKACFNFKAPLGGLRDQLADLTRRGFERFQSDGIM